jgi:hypothetical protein
MWTVFVTYLAFLGSGIWALWFGHKENTDSAKVLRSFRCLRSLALASTRRNWPRDRETV